MSRSHIPCFFLLGQSQCAFLHADKQGNESNAVCETRGEHGLCSGSRECGFPGCWWSTQKLSGERGLQKEPRAKSRLLKAFWALLEPCLAHSPPGGGTSQHPNMAGL